MSISTRQAGIQELADIVGASTHGDPEVTISGIATLELAQQYELSFFTNRKYHKFLLTTKASIVILHPDDVDNCPTNAILADDPYLAYAKIAAWLTKPDIQKTQIAENAVIADNVILGENVNVAAHVVIGEGSQIGDNVRLHAGCSIGDNVKIGHGTVLYANTSIYANVVMGEKCIVHSGAVIGSDGFGIANDNGQWFKVPQLGTVIIGNNVEIGANTTIDRGAIEDTVIENGVKLDNLIQIAHNVRIGENTAIAGCVGIAGSSTIGKHCAIGGGSGILGHLTIADHVHITATSLVTKSIKDAGVYSSGTPLQANAQWHKNFIRFKQLDKMARRLSELEKKI
ncbi:MAG: UDP-3-O-(3-hydroxymyristoyl)glucosamine N-acyltransferase [Gammaproteobacteria bacterium]|nr:UDP-3-O-(3-hydroxymyristoyl)glucosamine N-acyltransferase [Gammaproteobacteria bacterium]